MSDEQWEDIEVEIIGSHPHAGRKGTPNGKAITFPAGGATMYEIRFPEGDGCYAEHKHMRLLKPYRAEAKVNLEGDAGRANAWTTHSRKMRNDPRRQHGPIEERERRQEPE